MEKSDFVTRLQIKMLENQVKPKRLSELTGFNSATINMYLTKSRPTIPNHEKMEILAKALNTSVGYFYGEKDTKAVAEPSVTYIALTSEEILKRLWKHVFNEDFHSSSSYITSKLKEINLI